MRHIWVKDRAACEAQLLDADELVFAALQSDCDPCRTAIGIGGTREKLWDGRTIGVRPPLDYEPQPMENADEIMESARRARDGR